MTLLKTAQHILARRRDTRYLAILAERANNRGTVKTNGARAIRVYHKAQHIATVWPDANNEGCVVWSVTSKDIDDRQAAEAAVQLVGNGGWPRTL